MMAHRYLGFRAIREEKILENTYSMNCKEIFIWKIDECDLFLIIEVFNSYTNFDFR